MRQTTVFVGVLLLGGLTGWLSANLGMVQQPVKAEVATLAPESDLVAITKDTPSGSQVLYLIDPGQKVLSVYEYDPRKSKLKMCAARHYASDQLLSEFNNDSPHVAEIDKLVRQR